LPENLRETKMYKLAERMRRRVLLYSTAEALYPCSDMVSDSKGQESVRGRSLMYKLAPFRTY